MQRSSTSCSGRSASKNRLSEALWAASGCALEPDAAEEEKLVDEETRWPPDQLGIQLPPLADLRR